MEEIKKRNDKSHSADLSCLHRVKNAIFVTFRAVKTGNRPLFGRKKTSQATPRMPDGQSFESSNSQIVKYTVEGTIKPANLLSAAVST